MYEPILHVRGWTNGQTAIMVAILYSQMILNDILPSTLQDRDPDWDQEKGIDLAY